MSDFLQILKREEDTKPSATADKASQAASPEKLDSDTKKEASQTDFEAMKAQKRARQKTRETKARPSKIIKNDKKIYKLISSIKSGHILKKDVAEPVWLAISEASKFGGIQTKTLRRAIKTKNKFLKYKIRSNRYLIDLRSLIIFLHSNRKLENKLYQTGIGQYIKKWRE